MRILALLAAVLSLAACATVPAPESHLWDKVSAAPADVPELVAMPPKPGAASAQGGNVVYSPADAKRLLAWVTAAKANIEIASKLQGVASEQALRAQSLARAGKQTEAARNELARAYAREATARNSAEWRLTATQIGASLMSVIVFALGAL